MTTTTWFVRKLAPWVVIGAVLAAWWFGTANSAALAFPPLSGIVEDLGGYWLHTGFREAVGVTVFRLLVGFTVAVVAGIVIGLVVGMSPSIRALTNPFFEFIRSVPGPAFLPIAIVMLGIGDQMKIAFIAAACIWPVLLNTRDGVAAVAAGHLETARAFRLNNLQAVRFVILPSIAPSVFGAMRLSIGLAFIGTATSEFLASTSGVGYVTLRAQASFDVTRMWSGILVLAFLALLSNLAIVALERRALRWQQPEVAR